ncbi:hypothetical protein PGT21_029193 [Puccinia graminis f. sp. tritici]|uniref:Uncharacterized protein n=1 Tax=Puccinia graminis f. sp. tritici TaxID=56615 RepID=A0A5B0NFM3_PUCGR|nr:hypothetical protein PGT21_029193 [Puccinia graminis f. sp. tritici]KAA1095762.1 hypothetical protein PGTUg99_028802 [Puccinia graminis f. sp. tritici]
MYMIPLTLVSLSMVLTTLPPANLDRQILHDSTSCRGDLHLTHVYDKCGCVPQGRAVLMHDLEVNCDLCYASRSERVTLCPHCNTPPADYTWHRGNCTPSLNDRDQIKTSAIEENLTCARCNGHFQGYCHVMKCLDCQGINPRIYFRDRWCESCQNAVRQELRRGIE